MFKNNGTKQRGTIHFEWTPLEVVNKWPKAKRAQYWEYWEMVKEEKIKREKEEKEREEARKASRKLGNWLGMAALKHRDDPVEVVSGNGAASTGRDSKNPWGTKKEKKEQTGNGAAVEETEMATNVVAPVVVEHAPVQVAPVNAAVKTVVNAGMAGLVTMLTAQGIELDDGAAAAISAVVEANIKRDEPVVVEPVVVEPVVAAPVVVEPVEEETNTDASVVTETVDKNAVANAAATNIQALWRGYMQRKKPVDAPVVVKPVVKKLVRRSWADSDSEDENDEKSVAAPVVVEEKSNMEEKPDMDNAINCLVGDNKSDREEILRRLCKVFADNQYVLTYICFVIDHAQNALFNRLCDTFMGSKWVDNMKKFKKLQTLSDAQMDRATESTYYGINIAVWKGLGLTAAVIREMSSAICAAKEDVIARFVAYLTVAQKYDLLGEDKIFKYTANGKEGKAGAFYAPIVLCNALPMPKQVSVKTENRGFVRKEKNVKNSESTGAASAAGTTTNSASASVAQPVNDVLARTLRGEWFAVKPGDQNKKMSAEQKAFEDALDELVRVATGRSLVEVCAEYCREGGSVEIKGAVNAFIIAKVNVVETKSPYTNALIGSAMDEPENAGAVLVASEEDLVSILNGVKEEMKKAMEQASA